MKCNINFIKKCYVLYFIVNICEFCQNDTEIIAIVPNGNTEETKRRKNKMCHGSHERAQICQGVILLFAVVRFQVSESNQRQVASAAGISHRNRSLLEQPYSNNLAFVVRTSTHVCFPLP